MPVDKFGNGDRMTTVYTGINIANLTHSILRRDGGNTTIGAIDMNSNIIKKVADLYASLDEKNIVQSVHQYGSAFNQECEESGR